MKYIYIIGSGKMAEAIISGLRENYKIVVISRNVDTLKKLKNKYGEIVISKLDKFNIDNKNIIFAVKPYALKEVASKLEGKAETILSILAGTDINSISKVIDAKNYIRVMPNLSASYLKSATSITGDIEAKELAIDIFNKIGSTIWLDSEKALDISTGIVGSGPALLALFAESIMDGGVMCGLKRDESMKLTEMLFESFAPILSDKHPALIKDAVMSPAGTTSSAYNILEQKGVRGAIINSIEGAYQKALDIKNS